MPDSRYSFLAIAPLLPLDETLLPQPFLVWDQLIFEKLSALQSRLSSFLPAIQAANETLERERVEGRLAPRNIENVDEDDEQYIEMVSIYQYLPP